MLGNHGQWECVWSDFFDFHPIGPTADGKDLMSLDSIVLAFDPVGKYRFQPSPMILNPTHFRVVHDEALWPLLARAWRLRFSLRSHRGLLRRLFRALEIAFHACRFPTDGIMTLHDVGTRIALWISAFEVLLHPGKAGRVDEPHVLRFIEKMAWTDTALRRPRGRISLQKGKLSFKATLAMRLYHAAYRARNDFTHGNEVAVSKLMFGSGEKKRLDYVLPVLFGSVLVAWLKEQLPSCWVDDKGEYIRRRGMKEHIDLSMREIPAARDREAALLTLI